MMSNLKSADTEATLMITPSEVIEYLYCPRFIYFMNCLKIPQHEERRFKVIKGRRIHDRRMEENKEYLRRKIGCIDKEISVYLASPKLKVRGIVDEVLYLNDGTMAPLDFKYAEYSDHVFKTHHVQSVIYAMLIKETYKMPVQRGYICYVRGGSKLKEIPYRDTDFSRACSIIEEMFDIIEKGYFPKKTKGQNRCIDCCYRNVCV